MQLEGGFLVETRYSAWQKKKVRAIQVSAQAKTQHQRSIDAALRVARPYDRIELTGGEYAEAVTLNFPIELVASEGEDPQIVSRNSGITITAGVEVYLERLSVVSRSNAGRTDGALVVMAGTPILKHCTFTSVVIGGIARPVLEDCTIAKSAGGFGLIVQDAGGGTIKGCTIRGHRAACVDIDTRGELLITGCTLANEGADGVIVSATSSSSPLAISTGADSVGSLTLRCSGVKIEQCQLYVSPSSDLTDASLSSNIAGCPCCLTISNGAAPVIEANEFLEGEVGVLLDGAGPAQLRRNAVRRQRRCGVLALVEEGFSFLTGYESLRITGENVLDRCHIGIDVQCRGNARGVFGVSAEEKPSDALPSVKRAFQWLPTTGLAAAATGEVADGAGHPLLVDGRSTTADALKAALTGLIVKALRAHPTCLQHNFTIAAGRAGGSTVDTPGNTSGVSPIVEVLASMWGALPGVLSATSADELGDAVAAMLELRGNRGVDILKTKFFTCTLCAIRFGRQSYGLVEDCVFEDSETHAIVVDAAAHPLITGCRFLRSRGPSMLLSNFAHPLIVGNDITAGLTHGVEAIGQSRGILAGNLITCNRGCGVRVSQRSSTILCGNVLVRNRGGGVCSVNEGQPLLLSNRLSGNSVANVVCTGSSEVVVVGNAVQDSPDAGLLFTNCSRGTVIDNDVQRNSDGLLVELDADPVVSGNRIRENLHSGVLARNNALGSFTANEIIDNRGPNVTVTEGANPSFRGNIIKGSTNGGVVVAREGSGFFEKNRIGENSVANIIVVDLHSEPVFRANSVYGSTSGCGVVCARSAGGHFAGNAIHGNKQAGVYIVGAAGPVFTRNHISREAVGVVFSDGGKGHLVENNIEHCYGSGAISQREAEPLFEKNHVSGSGMSGLLITPDGLGRFLDNTFTSNDVGVQLGSALQAAALDLCSTFLGKDAADTGLPPSRLPSASTSVPSVTIGNSVADLDTSQSVPARSGATALRRRRSTFFSASDTRSALQDAASAVERRRASAARRAACQLRRNTITANANGGVLLECSGNGLVEENDIAENGAYGVRATVTYATQRAQRILEERFAITGVSPVAAAVPPFAAGGPRTGGPVGEVRLVKNRIHHHGVANVAFEAFTEKDGHVELVENDIHAAPMGVYVTNASLLPAAVGNDIHHCLDGMYFESSARGEMSGNRIHDCYLCGVYVSSRAEPTFLKDNTMEACRVCGVLVDAGGRGTFSNGAMRRCGLAGIIAYAGPTTPFHIGYDEVLRANIVSSTPTFLENRIEENETHGVLVLSVIGGQPLRTPRAEATQRLAEGYSHFPVARPYGDGLALGDGGSGGLARGGRLCAYFGKNTIERNRLCGVFHDRFEHWDLETIFADGIPKADGAAGAPSTHVPPVKVKPQPQQRQSLAISSDRGIKNAYGGYEILLGTSQIGDHPEHHRQRELKQVTFTDNTIRHCCIGLAAGYGCHPFLLRNRIVDNIFLGVLMRFGSAVMARECTVANNGLAGMYSASGAKGFISKCTIQDNNTLCRPAGRPHDSRELAHVMGPIRSVTVTATDAGEGAALDLSTDTAAAAEAAALRGAMEQLTHLAAVHRHTLTAAVRVLWEVACASSAAMGFASGCVPSAPSGAPTGDLVGSGAAAKGGLGGVSVPDTVRVCVADGGLGVWIEEGSRVTLSESTVVGNQHAGIYLAAGIARQHRILHRFFSMNRGASGATATGAGLNMTGRRSGVGPAAAAAVEAEVEGALRDLVTPAREQPLLAVHPPTALFTSHGLCATDVMAAAAATQLATAMSMLSDPQMDSSLTSQTLLSTDATLSVPVTARSDPPEHDSGPTGERVDSIHCALLVDNRIASNGEYGVFVEVSQALRAVRATTTGGARPTPSAAVAATASADDLAVMSAGDGIASSMDFHVVVEGNTITGNGRTGLFLSHLVDVHTGSCVPSRSTLSEELRQRYEQVQARLVLQQRSGPLPGTGSADVHVSSSVSPPFTLVPVHPKVHRALILGNDFANNAENHGEIRSRYVVCSLDGARTLLQLDPLAELATSAFSSRVLVRIPLTAAILSHPPPGMCLWEKNTFRDSQQGLRVVGYLGSTSVRLQRNRFRNIAEDAVLVEGHLAACTLGAGNSFVACGVAVRLRLDSTRPISVEGARSGGPSTSGECANDLRTRIFGNIFDASTQASLVVDRALGEPVLLHRNEFRQHAMGTAALLLSEHAGGGVLVQGSTFRDSYSPVIITASTGARGGAGAASTTGNDRWAQHTLVENYFTGNMMGLIVCGGARPLLQRNVFEQNLHAGLVVLGISTRPRIVACVFRNHRRADVKAAGAATSPKAAAGGGMAYPLDGTFTVLAGSVTVELVAANSRLLSPNSQVHLPAGVLLGPYAECDLQGSLFTGNDVGLDAARAPLPPSLASAASVARVEGCVFTRHAVAGVLVRHPEGVDTAGWSTAASLPARVADDGRGRERVAETTLISGCHFAHNAVSEEIFGDVVSARGGCAVFRGNTFFGTVQCMDGGLCHFAGNTFPTSGAEGGDGEAGERSEGAPTVNPAYPAAVLHAGADATLEENVFAFRRRGLLAGPDAIGQVRRNRFIACTTAVTVAPYNRTVIGENRILRSGDCGVLAFGGLVTSNEVYDAPTGIVLQPPAQYPAYNAIPSHKRSVTDVPLCSGNAIASCSGDGVLVTCSAKVEGNTVCKCQNGFNIVCPASMEMMAAASGIAGLAALPSITSNTVFDCANGIYIDGNCAANMRDNDVFDNDFSGVFAAETAAGTLQSNRISSANEHGAVEIPPESRMKVIGNTIRNHFSPVYNRATRVQRAKDHVTKRETIEAEVAALEEAVNDTVDRSTQHRADLQVLAEQLVGQLVAAAAAAQGSAAAAGSASRVLRRGSLDRALAGVADTTRDARTPTGTPTLAPRTEATRTHARQSSAGLRRTSRTATHAREQAVEAAGMAAGTPVVGSLPVSRRSSTVDPTATVSATAVRHVIIHVLPRPSLPNAHSTALALGEAVTRVLATPPLAQMRLSTHISTSTAQLTSTLRPSSGATRREPFLTVVVADGDASCATPSAQEALGLLLEVSHRVEGEAPAGATTGGPPPPHPRGRRRSGKKSAQQLMYLVHPGTLDVVSSGPAPLRAFADAANGCLAFRAGLEDALDALRAAIARDLRRPSLTATDAAGDVEAPAPQAEADVDNPTDLPDAPAGRGGARRRSGGRTNLPPALTRERISDVISRMTHEALGYATPRTSPKAKARSSSVVSIGGGGGGESGTTSPTGRKSVEARRASATGVPALRASATGVPALRGSAAEGTGKAQEKASPPGRRQRKSVGGEGGRPPRGPASRRASVPSTTKPRRPSVTRRTSQAGKPGEM